MIETLGVLALLFVLAVWWLAWHPDWGIERRRVEDDFGPPPPIAPLPYGDPGPIATEVERR